ncbi:MAG TPA: amino acid ABC transporter permease [Stellaceae bacterium]|nr:amino acid ABC transporter permease [Stellaceae bacterium]
MIEHLSEWMPQLWRAAGDTVEMMVVSFVLALFIGAALAVMGASRMRALSSAARLYINVIRGTPVLAQLFFIYFGLAEMGVVMSSYQAAVIGLAANSGAYVAEIYRAGIESIPKGQLEAARGLGLRGLQVARFVVIPQMMTVILPPLANQAVILIKETSVASLIAAPELMLRARDLASEYFMPLELYVVAGAMYFLLAFPISMLARVLEVRLRVYR